MKKYRFLISVMMSFIVINGFSQQSDIKYNNQNNRLKTLTPKPKIFSKI